MGERGDYCLSFCIYFLNPLRRIRATSPKGRGFFSQPQDCIHQGVNLAYFAIANAPSKHLKYSIIRTNPKPARARISSRKWFHLELARFHRVSDFIVKARDSSTAFHSAQNDLLFLSSWSSSDRISSDSNYFYLRDSIIFASKNSRTTYYFCHVER